MTVGSEVVTWGDNVMFCLTTLLMIELLLNEEYLYICSFTLIHFTLATFIIQFS